MTTNVPQHVRSCNRYNFVIDWL